MKKPHFYCQVIYCMHKVEVSLDDYPKFFFSFVCVTGGPLSMTLWSLFRLAGTFDFPKRFAVDGLVALRGSFLVCLLLPHLIHLSRRWRLHPYTEGGGVGEEEVSARGQGHLCFLSQFGTTLCAAR